MPRPDLTEQRTSQILDAAGSCIASSGALTFSLQQVADHAGVQKSIIRHYVGSKADLVDALTERVLSGYRATVATVPSGPPRVALDQLLDLLFTPDPEDDLDALVLDALVRSNSEYPAAVAMVVVFLDEIAEWLCDQLRGLEPRTPEVDIAAIADGILSMAIVADRFESLGGQALTSCRRAAEILIESLIGGRE